MVQLEIDGEERYLSASQVEDVIEKLQRQLQVAKDALTKIARPALGGKFQQQLAAAALAEIEAKS